MIPSAPASFNCGMISRTVFSSMIVSTATQSSRESVEIVGLRSAGNSFNNAASFARGLQGPTRYRVELSAPDGPSTAGGKQALQARAVIAAGGKAGDLIGLDEGETGVGRIDDQRSHDRAVIGADQGDSSGPERIRG